MAYTRRNFLNRVKEVNEVFIEHSKRGVFCEYIYEHYIQKQFHISRSTFYEYLTIPYAAQLKELDEQEARDKERYPTLF